MISRIKDYPLLGTVVAACFVLCHALLYDVVHVFPDVVGEMVEFDEAWSVYVAFAGVVAIAAGFAGVVIVFALGSETRPFRTLRLRGGNRLAANWVSPVATTLFAAFGAIGCAVLTVADHPRLAWWTFEFLVLVALMASLRLVWIFKALIELVRTNDEAAEMREATPQTLDEVRDRARRRRGAS